jgi:hypothetical protein
MSAKNSDDHNQIVSLGGKNVQCESWLTLTAIPWQCNNLQKTSTIIFGIAERYP